MYNVEVRVPLASSGLRDSDITLVNKVLRSGNLTMGAEVKNFEKLMCAYLKVKHFIMVNSGSSANLLMFEALLRPTKSKPKLHPGDGILVPAVAWPTTIWPVIQLGLIPIFVDIDPKTLALDLIKAQDLIDNSRIPVSGLFPIHPLGRAIPPSHLDKFATKNNLILINDICEALGSWSEGSHAGTSGLAGSFSFYFSHHITTMEGGGIATNDSELADDLRSMRSHGWSRDRLDVNEWTAQTSNNDSKFLFVSTGYNVRPMEIQAVIGSSQIKEISNFVGRRREIARKVFESLAGTELSVIGAETLQGDGDEQSNSWMLIPIYVSGKNAPLRKRSIVEALAGKQIETRPVLTGNFLAQPAIQRITKYAIESKSFKNAQDITDKAFLVGAHHDLTDEQIIFLCNSLRELALNKWD
jgi:CDP-6-deoxy-D-xylo-4-hexulose-3-dehydrase